MKKRIRLDNLEAIQALIDEAEGKATCRWLSADELVKKVKDWESWVSHPSKATLNGVSLRVQACATSVAKAYNYIPSETVAYLEHDTIGWYITKIVRETMKGHDWTVEAIVVTERLKEHILYNKLRY